MKVVAVSMVKNEADAIEAFARHTAAFVDAHLVFDHLSTDGTGFILRKLQREGLPLHFFHDDRPEYLQTHRTHRLLDRALRDHAADWVVPLDADEFIQVDGGPEAFRARLAELLPAGRPFRVWMRDYLASAEDDASEPNPVRRLTRRAVTPHVTKTLLPRAFAERPGAGWVHGNHHARLGDAVFGSPVRDDIWLAHLACRSAGQAVVKVVQYTLRGRAEGKWHTVGDNYSRQFRQLSTFPGPLLADPLLYGHGEAGEAVPAEYHGGRLRYPPVLTPAEATLVAVLTSAERIAADHGRLLEAVRVLTPPAGKLARLRWWLRQLFRGASVDVLPKPVDELKPELRDGLVLPDSRGGDALACAIEVLGVWRAPNEGKVDVTVKVRNTGLCTWLRAVPGDRGAVRLGVQLARPDGTVVERDFRRANLPADVEPGDAVTVAVRVPAPADPRLMLAFDLVAEGIRWFGCRGCRVEVPAASAKPRAA